MRWLALLVLVLIGRGFASEPQYPLWDGHESVADYAKKVNLPPTKTLDLGNGVKLEVVLIPAGKFIMGTPEPTPVDEEAFHKKIVTGQMLLTVSGSILLLFIIITVVQSIRQRRRPQFSLARLLIIVAAAGGCVLSGMDWRQSARQLDAARTEYHAAEARLRFADNNEQPAHTVTLMQPIYLGKFLVTQEQYVQVMGVDERLRFRGGQLSSRFGANFPVDWTDWEYAEMFCERMSLLTRQVVRLPTEAEWEYSCRAGTRAIYGASDEASDLDRIAWFGYNSNGGIRPVGQKEPNGFGLYDMLGNTQQWCADWYGEYTKDDSVDPQGPAQGKYRVSRGCSYIHAPEGCRVALRNSTWPNDRKGFRVRVSVFRTPFPASPPLPAVRPQWPQTDPPDPASTSKSASSSSSGPGF